MQRPFRVGRNCDAWCTRCRAVREHTIIAMVGNLPKRVQCSSCDGQHNYRDPSNNTGSTRRSTGSTTRTRKTRTRKSPFDWQVRLADKAKSGTEARAYATTEAFAEGDVVDHSSFGVGIVEKVLSGDKIEVLFSNGTRLLAHNR